MARDAVGDDGDDEVALQDGRGPERQKGRTEVPQGTDYRLFSFLNELSI